MPLFLREMKFISGPHRAKICLWNCSHLSKCSFQWASSLLNWFFIYIFSLLDLFSVFSTCANWLVCLLLLLVQQTVWKKPDWCWNECFISGLKGTCLSGGCRSSMVRFKVFNKSTFVKISQNDFKHLDYAFSQTNGIFLYFHELVVNHGKLRLTIARIENVLSCEIQRCFTILFRLFYGEEFNKYLNYLNVSLSAEFRA